MSGQFSYGDFRETDTLSSHSTSLHPGVEMDTNEFNAGK